MPDDRKQCWLMEGCPSRTGVCYSCVPDGDECPIWRWFKKQILLKEQEAVVRCKDCKHRGNIDGYCYKRNNRMAASFVEDDWFCADGERKGD